PPHIADVCTKEERLRASRENVALAVRAFNNIIGSLNAEERRLFSASITALERVYESGFSKLWSGQGVLEYFVKPCRTEADKLQRVVDEYKHGVQFILHHCRVLQSTLAVLIEKKKQYSADEFEQKQEVHRAAIKEKVYKIHTAILHTMKRLFDFFRRDYAENAKIRVEWHKFVEKIEKEIEESLKTMVKKSLQEIERNLSQNKDDDKTNGDGQLFVLEVEAVFGPNENKPTIETRPPVNTLSHKVINIGKEIIGIAKAIPRLEGALTKLIAEDVGDAEDKKFVHITYASPNPDTELQDTYHDFMTTEHEALQSMKRIRDAFDGIADKVKDELN
ncbi:MAG: hypothetical protein Q8J97_03355, partial [Flavobacteriaceae bacterium]|nr:hypothetical protein [Flavobacteriaceae bacterium]